MVFSSSVFVFVFLPITLILYYLAYKIGKTTQAANVVLLSCSIVFYFWGGSRALILLLVLVLINYVCAICMEKYEAQKKIFLILAIGIDLLNLAYFKYFNFFIENAQNLLHKLFHFEVSFTVMEIALPIGISFFTFQIMSYIIDVYRREVPVQKNLVKLTLYVVMFPQLIAGPIVRYRDVMEEIENRKCDLRQVENGIKRFIVGFAKKVFLANMMGEMADIAFSTVETLNMPYSWLGAICYTFQIFYDFSAYSDMAIGLGWIFGFHFNENFNYPYVSGSIKEFWRRWHISLSTWFRDYVYIPLGGNRKGKGRTYVNLIVVFLLTGFWHGAAWQFVFWGIYHGIFLIIERIGLENQLLKLPKVIQHLYAMIVVIVGWVFFRAENMQVAILYVRKMFSFDFSNLRNADIVLNFNSIFILCFVVSLLCIRPMGETVIAKKISCNKVVERVLYIILWYVAVVYMIGLSYNPFIYFQF